MLLMRGKTFGCKAGDGHSPAPAPRWPDKTPQIGRSLVGSLTTSEVHTFYCTAPGSFYKPTPSADGMIAAQQWACAVQYHVPWPGHLPASFTSSFAAACDTIKRIS